VVVKAINNDFHILPIKSNFTGEPGMEEFANALKAFWWDDTNIDSSFDPEQFWNGILAKVDQAIEMDPTKGCYFALRVMLDQMLSKPNEEIVVDLTSAINLAQAHETEWVIGTPEWANQGEFPGLIEIILNSKIINTVDSGNPQYNTAFEIQLDTGMLYYQRYTYKYWMMDLKDDPSAIEDLKMAAQLGYEPAIDTLQDLGL